MIISIKRIRVPDECPENCTLRYGVYSVNWCYVCPIHMCSGEYPKIPPSYYRPDWALQWKLYFTGKINTPELKY